MNRILIIGGTGNIGRQVLTQLASTDAEVRALVRKPGGVRLPPGVKMIQGDLTSPDTLNVCLHGIDIVFLVWTAPAAAVAPALAQITRHVRRIVFLSAPLKTPHPFFQQPNSGRALAEEIEQRIETSGLEWTFLRPGMFALNARQFWGPQIRAGDIVHWPYLAAPTAPVDERDIASVAVRTLTEHGHSRMEYVLTGPQSLTQHQQISTIGSVIGRTLRVEEVSTDEARSVWLKDMPPAVASTLLDAWAAAIGQPAFVTSTVEELTGKQSRTFAEWVTDHTTEFGT